ncbi:DUF3800 domain-containing protein [Lacihabitans sp. CS3-21]|uniref:DUF3800 domain-containing protein n=1 Tax=Lacihabitans sp. CS3-21 TaxID=2487332 RepID=UPI0020CF9C9B|nr:DUF3800 domain-containing protein [Lacihabitans sp. CS3-21]MCP9745984.1 DUF3800 domain-containing protein [Lacihabitans sp. CS3-21]
MNKTFNIYCDESCHLENDHKNYMFLGKISSAYNQVKHHTEQIRELKKKHNFFGEIKWTNVSKSKIHFYIDLVEYFFYTDLHFRAIGIDKTKIKHQEFGQTHDDFYYKMYYYLLNHNVQSLYNYNVYLDIKDTLSAYKVNKLKEILNSKYGVFRNIQNIRSHESILMQLTDFMMGAISYLHNNIEKSNSAKVKIIEKIKSNSNVDLLNTNYSDKLNLFFIELK